MQCTSLIIDGRNLRDDRVRLDSAGWTGCAPPVSARAARAVRRQRLCGLDLRGCLAPAPATGDRLDRRFARRAAGDVHGRHVPGQPAAAAPRLGPAASAAGLRPARAGHRRHRARGAVRHAACRTGLHALRRPRAAGHPAARGRGRGVLAAADAADGRDAAGDRALGRDRARGGVVAGLLLRRQHRRGGVRLPAGRLLPAARLRHGHGHLRRRRPQCDRGRDRPGPGGRRGPVRGAGRACDDGGAGARRPAPGPCIWRSRSPGCRRWAPRWSGPDCSR